MTAAALIPYEGQDAQLPAPPELGGGVVQIGYSQTFDGDPENAVTFVYQSP